ncbi:hypothetical protein GCM10009837_66490 [Streptomyces durmitorensis]
MATERALFGLAVRCHEGGSLRFRRRPAQGERTAAGFSAVVSDCRPWSGRRWGAGHLTKDAKPGRHGLVTECAQLTEVFWKVTVCDCVIRQAARPSRARVTDAALVAHLATEW